MILSMGNPIRQSNRVVCAGRLRIRLRPRLASGAEKMSDPKLVADQLGHGLGVNLDVYTVAALDKRQDALEVLESALACRGSA